jgi:hypothetical protein
MQSKRLSRSEEKGHIVININNNSNSKGRSMSGVNKRTTIKKSGVNKRTVIKKSGVNNHTIKKSEENNHTTIKKIGKIALGLGATALLGAGLYHILKKNKKTEPIINPPKEIQMQSIGSTSPPSLTVNTSSNSPLNSKSSPSSTVYFSSKSSKSSPSSIKTPTSSQSHLEKYKNFHKDFVHTSSPLERYPVKR